VRDEDVSALLGLIDRDLLFGASSAIAASDSVALLDLVERLSDYGADYRNFARELQLHFREILLVKVVPAGSPLLAAIGPEEDQRLRPLAAAYSEEDVLRAFEVLSRAEGDLRSAQDPRVTLEFALLKLAHLRRLVPFAELVARVESMAAGGALSPARPSGSTASPSPRSAPSPPRPMPSAPSRSVAPPPAAEAGAAPSSGDDLASALMAGAQARPSLVQPLRSAQVRLDGDTLVLEVASDFATFVEMHEEEYRELAAKAVGRKVKVRVAARAGATTETAGPTHEDLRRDKLLKDAAREPAVQDALDLFNGKVVDVREPKPAKETA
jgi:DNA polymerase-3 subunit gamma/tau